MNVYRGMNPDLKYGVMFPPKVSDKFPVSVWGGAGSSFMVSDRSPNKEEAVKFLKWLTEKEQQAYLAQQTKNLPANKEAISAIPDELADFSQAIEYATHPRVWGVGEFPQVIEAFDKGIQSIIIGEKDPGGRCRGGPKDQGTGIGQKKINIRPACLAARPLAFGTKANEIKTYLRKLFIYPPCRYYLFHILSLSLFPGFLFGVV